MFSGSVDFLGFWVGLTVGGWLLCGLIFWFGLWFWWLCWRVFPYVVGGFGGDLFWAG